jgi:hypothetical protein
MATLASTFVGSVEAGMWVSTVAVLGGALAAADLIFRTTTSRHHHHREEGQVAAALRLSLMCSGIPMSATLLSSTSSPAVALVFSFSLRFSVCASQRARRGKGGGRWEMGGAQIFMNLG